MQSEFDAVLGVDTCEHGSATGQRVGRVLDWFAIDPISGDLPARRLRRGRRDGQRGDRHNCSQDYAPHGCVSGKSTLGVLSISVLQVNGAYVCARPAQRARRARTVLVLSRTTLSDQTGEAIVLPISHVEPRDVYPITWPVPDGTLPERSWVLIGRPRAQLVSRLRDPQATLEREQLDEIVAGLRRLIQD